jgi:hypothetical protein
MSAADDMERAAWVSAIDRALPASRIRDMRLAALQVLFFPVTVTWVYLYRSITVCMWQDIIGWLRQRGAGGSRGLFTTPGDAVQVARIRAAIDAGESTGIWVPRVKSTLSLV